MTKAIARKHLARIKREYAKEMRARSPHWTFLNRSDKRVDRMYRQMKDLEDVITSK